MKQPPFYVSHELRTLGIRWVIRYDFEWEGRPDYRYAERISFIVLEMLKISKFD
jgi:hypothetical protein